DGLTWLQMERVPRGQSKMDLHFYSAIHLGNHHHIALRQRHHLPGDYVARTQSLRRECGKQYVAGPNADAQAGTGLSPDQRSLEIHHTAHEPTGHRASVLMDRRYGCVKHIFKSRELGHGLLPRRAHHLMRRAVGNDLSAVEYQHSFTQREHFFPAM